MMPRVSFSLEIATKLVDKVFDQEAKDILRLAYANNEEISVAQQLVDFFYNSYLRYPEEVTFRKAVYIFSYSKQTLLKLKLAKDRLQQLVTPENFFSVSHRFIVNDVTDANINIANTANVIDKKEITFGTSDSLSLTENKTTNRGATSQFNEEDISLEDSWRKQDLKDKKPLITENKKLFNIKLPDKLNEASSNTVIEDKNAIQFTSALLDSREEQVEPAIPYTNVGVNKNVAFTAVENASGSKGFTALYDEQTNRASTLQTNVGKTTSDVTAKNYVLNEALFKTLNMQIQDFREMFFDSFSCLFISLWDGY